MDSNRVARVYRQRSSRGRKSMLLNHVSSGHGSSSVEQFSWMRRGSSASRMPFDLLRNHCRNNCSEVTVVVLGI